MKLLLPNLKLLIISFETLKNVKNNIANFGKLMNNLFKEYFTKLSSL